MRLFVSYARVDKPYCVQIVNTLEVHEVWYDQRLYAGQNWWKEILRRLDWCEGFVYLLSPDSLSSEYCRKEFELALSLGRHIFPVLIHGDITLPPSLIEVQYADFSKGLTPESVKNLLNSIYIAERHQIDHPNLPVSAISSDEIKAPTPNPAVVISAAAAAMEKGQFDQAVFLLKQAKANNYSSQFINLDAILQEAVAGLERQAYLREAEREYKQIAELVRYRQTRKLGCEAFQSFRQVFTDYDPDSLNELCADKPPELPNLVTRLMNKPELKLPMLEWCEVPAGNVLIESDGETTSGQSESVVVAAFHITKYPATNAQYQVFLDEPSGYANDRWWQFSPFAHEWRVANPESKPSQFKGNERPREMVNWYDAMAFCNWLSTRLDVKITLPTENQWQRVARGDDNRAYPWGDRFDSSRCNTRESKLKMTTLVMRYPTGVSPFGLYDMAGNVWEWCLNTKTDQADEPEIVSDSERAVHGGAYIGPAQRAKISFRYYLKPKLYYSSIGFRIVRLD